MPRSFLCVCSSQRIRRVGKRKLQSARCFRATKADLLPGPKYLQATCLGVTWVRARRSDLVARHGEGGARNSRARGVVAALGVRARGRRGGGGALGARAGRRVRKHRSRRRGAGAAAACRAAGLAVGSRARPLACSALLRAASASGAVHQAGGAVREARCAVPRSRCAVRAAVRRGAEPRSPDHPAALAGSVRVYAEHAERRSRVRGEEVGFGFSSIFHCRGCHSQNLFYFYFLKIK